MNIRHVKIGVCGLSCLFCPRYQSKSESKCNGCKSELRMRAGCPFITCVVKKKRNRILHSILDDVAEKKHYYLKLRE